MDAALATVRFIHVGAGIIALFVAPGAMLTVKGGRAHRRCGKVYFWMMAVVALNAVILAVRQPNVFLLLLAVFSFYQALAGYRVLFRKRPGAGERATVLDWGAALLTLLASAAMIVLGIVRPGPLWERVGAVAVVFGLLGVVLAGSAIWKFVRPPEDRNAWWFDHMAGMLGSYIATVSAFSVVNFTFLPPVVRWLWPTAVGVPVIVLWIRYYRLRFQRTARPASAAI